MAELTSLQELLADRRLPEAAQDAWVWSGPSSTTQAAYRLLRDHENSEDPLILFSVETTSPSEDQGVCLAPSTTTTDDKIPAATYGTGRSSGMPVVRQGSGGLPTLILSLPLSPNSLAGNRRQPPRGDLGGGILAVFRRQNIPSQSRVTDYFCHTLVPLDP